MYKHISIDDIQGWERFYRANFLSCLSGFKPAHLIGTKGLNNVSNIAVFQNVVHLGANPALLGFINRPREATPHTLGNIEATGWFTMNSVHATFLPEAHQTSARYEANENEFEQVGLHEEYREDVIPPFVAESQIQVLFKLVEIVPIKHNNTFMIIGSVASVWLKEVEVQEDGFVDLAKMKVVATTGLDGYSEVQSPTRFKYPKPGIKPSIL